MQYFAYSQQEFVYKYVVMMSDVDQFKHMSFANYLKLMFLATDALLVSCNEPNSLLNFRAKLMESRMQFKRQTIVGDSLLIKVNASKFNGGDSYSFLYTFILEGTGELVALGRQAFRLIDLGRKDLVENLPNAMRGLLKSIEVDEENLLYKY